MKNTKRHRWVKYVTLRMGTAPHSEFGGGIELVYVLNQAIAALKNGTLGRKPKAGARQHMRIVDIQYNKKETHCAILFREVDVDGEDAVYEELSSGDVDPHPKKPGQGNRHTAHLIIDLAGKPAADNKQKFNALLEVVSGIPVTAVAQRLAGLGKQCGLYTGKKDGKSVSIHATFDLEPHVEKTIRAELTEGVLDRFTLQHDEPKATGFDEQNLIRQKRRQMEFAVVTSDVRGKLDAIWSSIKAIAQKGHYELVRAHYETPDGRAASAEIDVARADALEQMISRITKLTLDADHHQDQRTVAWPLVNKMILELGKKKS